MDAGELLTENRIVPVLVIEDLSIALDLALALRDAGVKAIEITLRTKAALPAIELISSQVQGMIVGAGSVRIASHFEEVVNHGASFAVSPGATDSLLEASDRLKMPFIPGAVTASEIISLSEKGYQLQKFFPAELSGGTKMLKALSAPLPEIRFFPTGGINAEVAQSYLALECVTCIGGSWFISPDYLADKNFKEISKQTAEALSTVHV